jgi:di/tricarboxylate transporter
MAIGIFAFAIGCVLLGLADLMVATVAAAFAMVATGCLNIRQATRAIDPRIVMMIGTALAMGSALQVTGGDRAIAAWCDGAGRRCRPDGYPVGLFSGDCAPDQHSCPTMQRRFCSPRLRCNWPATCPCRPEPFVMAVLLAANCSFATPIGYQTNLVGDGPWPLSFCGLS